METYSITSDNEYLYITKSNGTTNRVINHGISIFVYGEKLSLNSANYSFLEVSKDQIIGQTFANINECALYFLSLINKDTGQHLWQKMARQGSAFSSVTGFVTVSGSTETDFLLMKNPVSSGVLVRFKEFIMTIGGASTNSSIIRFYRSPTITSDGTPLSISKVLPTASQTSAIEVFQSPTISARGSLIQLFSIDFKSFSRDQDLSRFLTDGSNLLVTVDANVTNVEHNIVAIWAEEQI